MKKNSWFLLTLAALAWFNAGAVWLIRFSCYPLWPRVGRDTFGSYFQLWQQSTWSVVAVPFALTAIGSLVLLFTAWSELPLWMPCTGLALQAAIVLVRSFWLRPLEQHIALLSGQSNDSAYGHLIAANSLLIGLVTSYAVLALWMWSRTVGPATLKTRRRSLLFVTFALGLYAVGNVWLVHLVSYRLWPYVGKQKAYAYHIAWWHSIWGVLFVPAGVVLLGSLAMLWIRPEGVSRSTGRVAFALQVLTYIVTGAWFAPLMARLATPEGGLSLPMYHLLMTTHWVRVALFTAFGVVCCYMLAKSATKLAWTGT
jgi:hypothetical protein